MKFMKMICLVLCLAMMICPVLGVSAEEADPSVGSGCRSTDAQRPLGGSEKMLDTSRAVVVYERNTGSLIYAYQADEQIYPSSMVKLMTALVALQRGNLDDVVTVTRTALDSVGIGVVSANLVRGEEISLRDLLYLMMVASANDASAVIAEHIGGTQEGFVALMNETATQIGLNGTHFSNAHGLHDEQTYTTVRDVLKILDVGLENPEFRTMFETVSYTVPATNKSDERVITSTNNMMNTASKYYDDRVIGGKTGATDEAGRCLAVTANVGDMELIAVVMGAKATYSSDGSYLTRYGSFEEMSELLDYVQSGYACRQLFYKDQVIAQYAVQNGACNVVTTPADESYCVLPKGIAADELTWKYPSVITNLPAPVGQHQTVTVMEVWYGDICLAQTELIAMNSVAQDVPLAENRITQNEKTEQKHGEVLALILGVILGIVLLVIVALLLVRVIQTALIKARVRRRRKNRRRDRNARME